MDLTWKINKENEAEELSKLFYLYSL